jgi:hypothetical protein
MAPLPQVSGVVVLPSSEVSDVVPLVVVSAAVVGLDVVGPLEPSVVLDVVSETDEPSSPQARPMTVARQTMNARDMGFLWGISAVVRRRR